MTLDRNKLRELKQLAREKKAFIRTSEDAVCDGARISPYPELDDILAELEAAESKLLNYRMLDECGAEETLARTQIEWAKMRERAEAAEERVRELTQQRDDARNLNEWFRNSVGECHVMISRDTPEFQIQMEWESTSLPPRLQKVMRAAAESRTKLSVMETALRETESVLGACRGGNTYGDCIHTARRLMLKALSDQGGNNGA